MRAQLITKNSSGKTVKRSLSNVNGQASDDQIKGAMQALMTLISGETAEKFHMTVNQDVDL